MRQSLISVLVFSLISNSAYAICDSKDIQKQEDGSYRYSKECHNEVGKTFGALEKREQQVEKLEKVIELKDLSLDKSYERIEMWRDTTYKLEDRVNTMEQMKKNNEVLYFILGIAVTGLAVYGAGQLK